MKVKEKVMTETEVNEAIEIGYQEGLFDAVNPSHYTGMRMSPAEFIHMNDISFLEGNVIKYICRHKNKNGIEDVKKAIKYCELLLEWEYGIAGADKCQ